ncbi:calcium/sodium antiporter [Candidatus Manganitrophus noduliformans]|uniref:Calcium/sodium antiporter n=1 Tax=Candidatus Manganitrophus noduliformans TaxID=2606439 RepID=A0A7X6DR74_9BACT|nr:calcium/sodium antiporter [Candidatus Manganitrophus noduliformans]
MEVFVLLGFVAGIVLLLAGAEFLVRGASRIASALGLPPVMIGLTVVAIGTGAPEITVSVASAWIGRGDLAVGNIVGSNIMNILFVLGASAAITPLVVARRLVRIDVPIMIGVSLLLVLLAIDGRIGRMDGALLFAGLIGYMIFLIRQVRGEPEPIDAPYSPPAGRAGRMGWQILRVLLGLALLITGSRWMIGGAVSLARAIGVSELVIGLTIVAVGTSLPEAATSLMAAIRGRREIAVGNVIGSNIFNILGVVGIAGVAAPRGIAVSPAAMNFDFPVMLAAAAAALPIFFTGYRIARWEGFLFLGHYIAYTAYLILKASEHDALPAFSGVMQLFVLPLTAVTLIVVVVRGWRAK